MKHFLIRGSFFLLSVLMTGCYPVATVGYSEGYYDGSNGYYNDDGYYYGTFNSSGYYFNHVFFPYDRYYTYDDRLHHRGYFAPHRHHRRVYAAPPRINERYPNHGSDPYRRDPVREERRERNDYRSNQANIKHRRFDNTQSPKDRNQRRDDTSRERDTSRDSSDTTRREHRSSFTSFHD